MSKESIIKFLFSAFAKARVPFQLVLALIFIFHIFAILIDTPPRRGPVSSRIHSFTSKYLSTIGVIQSWKMFISAPLIHKYQIRTVFTDKDGNDTTLPPMIPGFRDIGTHFKEELFFARSTSKKKWYLTQYLKRACKLASQKEGKKFKKARLLVSKDVLQKIDKKNKGKITLQSRKSEHGLTLCDS